MTAAEKLLAHIRSLENAPLETHDDGQRLSLLLAANAGLLPGVDGVVGTEAPAHVYDDTGNVGDWRYDAATQTRWNRVWNDDTRQIFTVDLSASLSGGLLTEDVYLFATTTGQWSMNLLTTGLADGAGNWASNTDAKDESAAVVESFYVGESIETDLTTYFSGFTVTITTTPAVWSLDLTGLADAQGLATEDLNVFETGPSINTTILEDEDVADGIASALGAGYTATFAAGVVTITQEASSLVVEALPALGLGAFQGLGTVAGATLTNTPVQDETAEIALTLDGPAGRYPVSFEGDWVKTLDNTTYDEDFAVENGLGFLGASEDPETEIPSILGTVEGSATFALETDTDVWGIVQAVGDPRSAYPLVSPSSEIRLLVGDTTKTAVAPSAATYPLPQWVSDPVANLP